MNDTVITLIPKCQSPERIEEYRPISLCTTLMKIATKAIAIRLGECLPHIISQSQSAFVRGRLISDNVLVAHEVLHFIKTRKAKKDCYMSLKLDMCKAYDRIEWKFLEEMLRKLGFLDGWINLIMKIVSTVSYTVKINGSFSEKIVPSRGLRQGDPLSPYLFILCSEWLSCNLDQAIRDERLKGVKVGSTAPVLSHLLFADDCLVFMRAEVEEARVVKAILEEYELLSGQKINLAKSEIVFGKNVTTDHRDAICDVLGVKQVEKHSSYLGLPTVIGHNKREVFRSLEDRVCSRINDWKSKVLSRAGKETLIKAVVQAIPLYAMQSLKIPLTLCDRLEKAALQFWWTSSNHKRPIHWIRKEVLFKSKEEGGLGLRRMNLMNDALLLKQVWRVLSCPNLLLSQIFKARYFVNTSIMEAGVGYQPSHVWRNVYKVKHLMWKGLGGNILDPQWSLDSSGEFTTASAYRLLELEWRMNKGVGGESSDRSRTTTFWRKIWKSNVPKRIQMVNWRAFYNGLPALAEFRRRGCLVEGACGFCGLKQESTAHIFIDCWWAKALWRVLHIMTPTSELDTWQMADWLLHCEGALSKSDFSKLMCGISFIWDERNARFHGSKEKSVEEIQYRVEALLYQMNRLPGSLAGLQFGGEAKICIYCDASWRKDSRKEGLAVVVIENGIIMAVNAKSEDSSRSVTAAEGGALIMGMKLAATLFGHQGVCFKTDSAEVSLAASMGYSKSKFNSEWLAECSKFLIEFKGWEIGLIGREDNLVADAFARRARREDWGWLSCDAIPRWPDISELLKRSG